MWRVAFLSAFFLSATSLRPAASGAADIFRWVDERGVVHFTDNAYNIPEKKRASATRIEAREPSRGSNAAVQNKTSVSIQKQGAVAIVPATINESTRAAFVVDTGASYTMISQAMARELNIDLSSAVPKIPFQTANGTIMAPLVTLESIEVGGLQVKELSAAVHDIFPDPRITGLLGLNFLSQFRIDIDTQNGVLVLEKR